MTNQEFTNEIKRRKAEITRAKNKNKTANIVLADKVAEYRRIKELENALTEFKLSYYQLVPQEIPTIAQLFG